MKIKIFKVTGSENPFSKKPSSNQVLEDKINDWLATNSNIKIVDIKQSCCGGSFSPSQTIVSVFYEPQS